MAESASYTRRGHGGAARETTLASGADASTNTLTATDLSTWTSTISSGPARATLTDGTNEEEVEYTGISTNTLTGVTRGVGGTTAQAWSAGVTIFHGSSVRDFDEANYAVAETVGKITAANQLLVGDGANSMAALDVAASRIVGRKASGDVVALTSAEVKAILALDTAWSKTVAVQGEVKVPSGAVDYLVPFTVHVESGEVLTITKVYDAIRSGTSVTYKITVDGVDEVTGLSATTTHNSTDVTDFTVADGERLAVVVTAVSGTPDGLEVTLCGTMSSID